MTAQPKIAVVVPVRNGAETITAAIRSVIGQSVTDFELIVVDDNSTDLTVQYVQSFDDPRVQYHKLRNASGANAARNAGIALALSDKITFLDADDHFLPHALKTRLDIMESWPCCGFALTSYRVVKASVEKDRKNSGGEVPPPEFQRKLMDYSLSIGGSGITVRREFLDQCNGWNESLNRLQDRDLLVRLAGMTPGFVSDTIDWVKHDRPGSISGQGAGYMKALAAFAEANSEVASRHRSMLARRVAQRMMVNLLSGRLSQARLDYLDNLREPALGFSVVELLQACLNHRQ